MTPIPNRYRKRPVEIDAVQFDGTDDSGRYIIAWIQSHNGDARTAHVECGDYQGLWIDTLEGQMAAGKDDFVVRGVQGEFYPVKESIFRETYDYVGVAS